MKYTVVENADIMRLAGAVNEMIKDGWVPHGGVSSYSFNEYRSNFMQAMVQNSGVPSNLLQGGDEGVVSSGPNIGYDFPDREGKA